MESEGRIPRFLVQPHLNRPIHLDTHTTHLSIHTPPFHAKPSSWLRTQVIFVSRGPLKGIIDLSYLSKSRKPVRSRVEVAVAVGVFPKTKSVRQMPRDLLALIAQETREKFLVANELFCVCTRPMDHIDSLRSEGGQIIIEWKNSESFDNDREHRQNTADDAGTYGTSPIHIYVRHGSLILPPLYSIRGRPECYEQTRPRSSHQQTIALLFCLWQHHRATLGRNYPHWTLPHPHAIVSRRLPLYSTRG